MMLVLIGLRYFIRRASRRKGGKGGWFDGSRKRLHMFMLTLTYASKHWSGLPEERGMRYQTTARGLTHGGNSGSLVPNEHHTDEAG